VRTNEVLQRVRTQVDDVDGRRAACTNVASGNGGRRATCTNVGQRCVPTKFCNTYERRSAVLTAYEQRVRMLESSAYQRASATRTNAGRRCRRQTSSTYECRTAVGSNKVLKRVLTQVDDVDGRRVARTNVASGNDGRHAAGTNVGQQCVPTRFCKAYERSSAVFTADLEHVHM